MSTCAKFDYEINEDGVYSGYIALGLIIGIIVGFLLTFILLWVFCCHIKFRNRSFNTCILSRLYSSKAETCCGGKLSNSFTCLDRGNRRVDATDHNGHRRRSSDAESPESGQMRRRKSSGLTIGNAQMLDGADVDEDENVMVQLDLADSATADSMPMIDAITQATEAEGDQELLRQDWAATGRLELDLWRSRLLGLWQLAGALINRLAERGHIDEATRQKLVREHTSELAKARARAEAALAEERQRRAAAAAKSNAATSTPEEAAEAAAAEEARRAAALDSAAQAEVARLRRRLGGLPGLAAGAGGGGASEQADALVAALKAGVARLEGRLASQRLRQCAALEETLARRRQLLAQQKAEDDEAAYGMELLMESRRLQLADLVRDKRLTEAERLKLMAAYQKGLLKQKEAFEKSYLIQRRALAERLRAARASQSAELEQRHTAEVTRLTRLVEAGTETDPERALEAFADLLDARLDRRDALHAELDGRDCNQLAVLRDDLLQEKANGEDRTEEELGRSLGLSEEDLGRMLDLHRRQVDKIRKDRLNERQRSQRKLEHRLAQRQAKYAAARSSREAELAEVKRGQDLLLQKALTFQLDLDESARQQIVEEHERQLLALGNSLQLSRLRQEKGLEVKLAARRAAMGRMRRETREAQVALDEQKAAGGEAARLAEKLDARLDEEQRKLTAESREGRQRLRDRLAEETAAALLEQEARLSGVIGRMQTGQARRRGLIDRQEKVMQQLEAELEARLSGGGGGGGGGDMRGLDQLLQSHKNQVANLTGQMDRERRQQEMFLKERLERRKLEREDEVKDTVDKEEQESARALNQSGHGQIARYVLEMSLDAKFRNSMLSMEEDMRLEMRKQQEQLDREMEADLQKSLEEQRKRLFGELARLTSIPKAEMKDMVERAGSSAGAGRRLTRQVSKDITDSARQLRREEGDDADDYDPRRSEHRRPSSSKKSSSTSRGRQYSKEFDD